ncbi:MAG: tetratricopeptide repeat protein [Bacteroidia bacterium]
MCWMQQAVVAQSTDSLRVQLQNADVDQMEIALSEWQARFQAEADSASALRFTRELEKWAEVKGPEAMRARFHYAAGWFNRWVSLNYARSIMHYDICFELAESSSQRRLMANAMLQAMETFLELGLFDEAIQYLFKAEQVFQKYDYEGFRSVTGSLFSIGQFFYRAGNHEQSVQYFEKALVFNDLNDDDYSLMHAYNSLGLSYLRLGSFQKAIEVFQISNQMAREMGDTGWEALTYGNIGMVYAEMEDYEPAIAHLSYDIESSSRVEGWTSAGNAAILMCEVYLKKGTPELALIYLQKAQDFSQREPSLYLRNAVAKLAASVYSALGRYREAFDAQKSHEVLGREIRQRSMSQEKAQMAKRTRYEKQKVALGLEKQIEKLQRDSEQLYRIVWILGSLLLLTLAALMVLLSREKNLRRLQEAQHSEALHKRELAHLKKEMLLQIGHHHSGPVLISPDSWEQLRMYMNLLYDNYFGRLKTSYPELTAEDIQYMALLKLKCSEEETAALASKSMLEWEQWKLRLEKKLGGVNATQLLGLVQSL